MGIPALLREGMSWRDVKLRAMQHDAGDAAGAGGARRRRRGIIV